MNGFLQRKGTVAIITLTRLNGSSFVLNALLIETVEATPDTVITLTNGKKFMVQEDVQSVVERTVRFLSKSRAVPTLPSELSGG